VQKGVYLSGQVCTLAVEVVGCVAEPVVADLVVVSTAVLHT